MANVDEEILRLTGVWYEYVNFDHHKDRDCHWTIEENWSYGDYPTFQIVHEGYIGERIRYDVAKGASYERAKEDLLRILKSQIRKQQEWARECLREPEEWMEQDEAIKFILAEDLDG